MVGENGPELVLFHGGETVLNAAETAETMRHITDSYNQSFSAYAAGTDNAAPGPALVGEEGPELVWMQGANQSFWGGSAQEMESAYHDFNLYGGNSTMTAPLWDQPAASDRLAPASNSVPPLQVIFQIGGNATQETVQDLREFADEIVGRVMDAIEDAQADAVRGALK